MIQGYSKSERKSNINVGVMENAERHPKVPYHKGKQGAKKGQGSYPQCKLLKQNYRNESQKYLKYLTKKVQGQK